MKRLNTASLAVTSLALSLLVLACGPNKTQTKETVSSPAETTPVTTSEDSGYTGLELTEDEIKMLEERGVANVDSAEVASKIAGFEVAVPTYIPEGFAQGQYSVSISGAGLPEGLRPKFNNTRVQIIFSDRDDKQAVILLVESTHESSIGSAGIRESVDICGSAGESVLVEASPADGKPYDHLILRWEKDGIYYAITGILGGNLDQSSLLKMACSLDKE